MSWFKSKEEKELEEKIKELEDLSNSLQQQVNAATGNVTSTTVSTHQLPISGSGLTIGGSSGVFGGGAGSGLIFGGSGGSGGYTITMPPGITIGVSITHEEQKELEDLRKEHKQKIKTTKLGEFKKLPSELRQFVINALTWQEAVSNINTTDVEKNPRLLELENKVFTSNFTYSGTYININGFNYANIITSIGLPEDTTSEEIKQAHLEATLEEEMLNEQSNI